MTPGGVFILFLLLINTMPSKTDSESHFGKSFVAFWPENIAHYHPTDPENRVHVTALYGQTSVTVTTAGNEQTMVMSAGQSTSINIAKETELRKEPFSNKTSKITSDLDILVQAISKRSNSIQVVLLMPTDNFGSKFFIPPIVSSLMVDFTTAVTERNPVRLIFVGGAEEATVTVTGSEVREVKILPNEVSQLWLGASDTLVESDTPVGAFLSHSCLVHQGCVCGLLYTMLPPAKDQVLKFFIPPRLALNAESETFILKAEEVQTEAELFNADSPQVEFQGTAYLRRPGLLLPLLGDQDMASCFMVPTIAEFMNSVLIVVHGDKKAGVFVQKDSQAGSEWTDLKGTGYVSTEIAIHGEGNLIWHADSTMAVYVLYEKDGFFFGSSATAISKTPDFRGCALKPEVVQLGEVVNDWPESVQYCRGLNLDLICFNSEEHRLHVNGLLAQSGSIGVKEAWIGMRRSSLTGDWYWSGGCPVATTNWAEGEPGQMTDGQCVMMDMEEGQEFNWRDEMCCKAAAPLCGQPAKLFEL